VLAGQPGGELVVAQRGADPVHLVGGHRLALAAAAEDDADVGVAAHHRPGRRRAERRVVDWRLRVGAQVGDVVALLAEVADEEGLEAEAGVVGGQGDAHGAHPAWRVGGTLDR